MTESDKKHEVEHASGGIDPTKLSKALILVDRTIRNIINSANENFPDGFPAPDLRKLEGFDTSCRLLAKFALSKELETEARVMSRLTRCDSPNISELFEGGK